jgi:hypothetical protein
VLPPSLSHDGVSLCPAHGHTLHNSFSATYHAVVVNPTQLMTPRSSNSSLHGWPVSRWLAGWSVGLWLVASVRVEFG